MLYQIKFKAWDTKAKLMYIVAELHFTYRGLINAVVVYDAKGAYYDLFPDDVELLPFTGLHDKNGKEIYEEDVLYLKHAGYFRVKSELGGFELIKLPHSDFHYRPLSLTGHINDHEIVGNLLENPHLLELKDE